MGAWPGFIWLRIDNLRALGNMVVNPSSSSRVGENLGFSRTLFHGAG